MLGRREEDAEREELERQMREQEEMEAAIERGEELARQARLRVEQLPGEEGAGAGDVEQRNLDDDIPDADEGLPTQQENADEAEEDVGDADLDHDIPDAEDAENSLREEDSNIEGETGITDEVELTNIRDADTLARLTPTTTRPVPANQNRGAPPNPTVAQPITPQTTQAMQQVLLRRRELEQQQQQQQQQQAEQEALANAMLEEDEQALADRDLDAEIPDEDVDENDFEIQARDLDDEIPEADDDGIGEGEWQHTDTELEEDESAVAMLMDDEGEEGGDVSMDMSVIDGGGRRSIAGNMLATPASLEASSMLLHTPATTGDVGSGARGWLNRRSLSGTGRAGNLSARFTGSGRESGSGSGTASPQASAARLQPQTRGVSAQEQSQAQDQQQQVRRRSGRHGLRRENRSVRDSLD